LKKDEDGLFEDDIFWKNSVTNIALFKPLEVVLSKAVSWSPKVTILGNVNSNTIDIGFENNIVDSVSFRIDFTSNYELALRTIIDFCILNGFMIINNDLQKMPLNFEAFKQEIEKSQQIQTYRRLSE